MKKNLYLIFLLFLFFSCFQEKEGFNITLVYDEPCDNKEKIINGIALGLNETLPEKSFNISEMNMKPASTAKEIKNKLIKKKSEILFVSLENNNSLDKLIGIASDLELPIINPENEKQEYRDKTDNLFFITPSKKREAKLLAQVVVEDYIRKISIIRDEELFENSYSAIFKENFSKAGGRIVNETEFSSSDEINTKEICRSASIGTEALLIMASVDDTVSIIKSIKASTALKNYYVPSKTIYYNTELTTSLKDEEIYLKFVSYTPYEKTGDAYQEFLKKYQISYDKSPDYVSEYSYIATKMLVNALQMSLETKIKLIEAMKNGKRSSILEDEFLWDSQGDPSYSSYSFQLINNQFQILKEL